MQHHAFSSGREQRGSKWMPPSNGRVPQRGAQGLGQGGIPFVPPPGFSGGWEHDHPKLQVRRLRPLALVLILSLYFKKKKA